MIVDAHVHLWDAAHTPQPWMTSEHASIARPFDPSDLVTPADVEQDGEEALDLSLLVAERGERGLDPQNPSVPTMEAELASRSRSSSRRTTCAAT